MEGYRVDRFAEKIADALADNPGYGRRSVSSALHSIGVAVEQHARATDRYAKATEKQAEALARIAAAMEAKGGTP